jgi:hypothetical protein
MRREAGIWVTPLLWRSAALLAAASPGKSHFPVNESNDMISRIC